MATESYVFRCCAVENFTLHSVETVGIKRRLELTENAPPSSLSASSDGMLQYLTKGSAGHALSVADLTPASTGYGSVATPRWPVTEANVWALKE